MAVTEEEVDNRFVNVILSDSAAVNPAFVRKMQYNWIPCACHRLHLVVQDALECVEPLLQRHRNIVYTLGHSHGSHLGSILQEIKCHETQAS